MTDRSCAACQRTELPPSAFQFLRDVCNECVLEGRTTMGLRPLPIPGVAPVPKPDAPATNYVAELFLAVLAMERVALEMAICMLPPAERTATTVTATAAAFSAHLRNQLGMDVPLSK